MNVQTISLKHCEFRKESKTLAVASEIFGGCFPSVFRVRSVHTSRVVTFRPVGENHPAFDQDQWDGEQMVYAPIEPVSTVDTMVVYHAF